MTEWRLTTLCCALLCAGLAAAEGTAKTPLAGSHLVLERVQPRFTWGADCPVDTDFLEYRLLANGGHPSQVEPHYWPERTAYVATGKWKRGEEVPFYMGLSATATFKPSPQAPLSAMPVIAVNANPTGDQHYSLIAGKGSFNCDVDVAGNEGEYVALAWNTIGATCVFVGRASPWEGYAFEGDSDYPLVFQMLQSGYTCICGRGTVTHPDGHTDRIGYEDIVETWLSRITSEERVDRLGAVIALGYLARGTADIERVVLALVQALKHASPDVRFCAAETLGRLRDPRAAQGLRAACDDDHPRVRQMALASMELVAPKSGSN